VHLNGATEIPSTVGNFGTSNIGNLTISNGVGSGSVTPAYDYDDVYVVDSGGAVHNGFLNPGGFLQVSTLVPTADGSNLAWTPSAAGSHFNKVNELSGTFPDGDTTYVTDTTSGDADSYQATDLRAGSVVYGLQTNLYARNVGNFNGTSVAAPAAYAYLQQLYDLDPTGAAWTLANVNADEFGVVQLGTAAARVSQLAVEVLGPAPPATARLSQEVVEALTSPGASVRLSQEVVEVLRVTSATLAHAALSQEVVESVIQKTLAEAIMSQMVVEVLVRPNRPHFRATIIDKPQ
jgi:hypothetical protein